MDSWKCNLFKFGTFRACVWSSAGAGSTQEPEVRPAGRWRHPLPRQPRPGQALRRGESPVLDFIICSDKVWRTCARFLFPTHCLGKIQLPGSETSTPAARLLTRSRGQAELPAGTGSHRGPSACARPGGCPRRVPAQQSLQQPGCLCPSPGCLGSSRGAVAAGRGVGTVPPANRVLAGQLVSAADGSKAKASSQRS